VPALSRIFEVQNSDSWDTFVGVLVCVLSICDWVALCGDLRLLNAVRIAQNQEFWTKYGDAEKYGKEIELSMRKLENGRMPTGNLVLWIAGNLYLQIASWDGEERIWCLISGFRFVMSCSEEWILICKVYKIHQKSTIKID